MQRAITTVLAGALCGGCGGGESGPPPPSGGPPPDATAAADLPTGTFGTATLTATARWIGAVPERGILDLGKEPSCAATHGHTPPRNESLVVNANGTLRNVFVYVKSGLPKARWAAPATPIVLDQIGCIYVPHVVGVQAGQPFEVRNSDGVMHNVRSLARTNERFNVAQPKHTKRVQTFARGEVMVELRCDYHGWMQAWVGVCEHPFFAVTTDAGTATIPRLPAGTYTLVAWHESQGTRTTTVSVSDGATVAVDFSYGAGEYR